MGSSVPEIVEIVTTVASAGDAARLARGAVEARLAACAGVSSVRSWYRWDGAIQEDEERQVVFKTTAGAAAALEAWLAKEHPYDVPAILRIRVDAVNAAYATWAQEALR